MSHNVIARKQVLTSKFYSALQTSYFDFQAFLDAWLGRRFIREAAFNYMETTMVRQVATSTNDFIKKLLFFTNEDNNAQRHRTYPHVYVSVYNYKEINPSQPNRPEYSSAIINKLLFDFDAEVAGPVPTLKELELPYQEARTIAGDLCGYMIFTAGKGFQVHIDLPKEITIEEMRKRQTTINNLYGWEDGPLHHTPQFKGDVARLCRLPFSIHPISGMQSIPVTDPKESLETIYKKAHTFTKPFVIPYLNSAPAQEGP